MLVASSVATIRTENTLLHALMVLSSVGYSSIPVLDNKGHLKGILSLALIINGIKSTENYDWDQLAERQVHEIMETKPPRVLPSADLEDVLHLLVDRIIFAALIPGKLLRLLPENQQAYQSGP